MIEKMEFLRLTGPKGDFDRVIEKYLSKYEIHLENALAELSSVQNLKPFIEINPYKAFVNRAQTILARIDKGTKPSDREMDAEEAMNVLDKAYNVTQDYRGKIEELREERKRYKKLMEEIEPFRMLDYDTHKILDLRFIKFRFGRIAHQYYNKFSKYVYDNLGTVFLECDRDSLYVWGIYFMPASSVLKVDAIYSSLHFERVYIADEYEGKPEEAYQSIKSKVKEIDRRINDYKDKIKQMLNTGASDILRAYSEISQLNQNFEIRKLAACTKEKQGHVFYILCGWMVKRDAKKFLKEIEEDEKIYCIDDKDENEGDLNVKPPTKLKNPKIVRPFEMFVEMYGLPDYHEIDPTMFIAITYTLMFGIMFGDVGQGLCLLIGGALMYRYKRVKIAAIIAMAGIWSVVFGFLYGSVFGFEDWIPAVWMHPMHDIMKTLMISVAFGVVLILIAMLIHILNAIKQKNAKSLFLDASGITGLMCYGVIVVSILLAFTGRRIPSISMIAILVGVPLLILFLKEPIGNLIDRKKKIMPKGSKAMFFLESFVELFDIVLSYATNTLSFLRVGAFALSHAGMMGVVFALAEGPNGRMNLIIVIIGNVIVAGLEALVVGIQVLRLEYYEMFSRFYKGSGKAFQSIKDVTGVK